MVPVVFLDSEVVAPARGASCSSSGSRSGPASFSSSIRDAHVASSAASAAKEIQQPNDTDRPLANMQVATGGAGRTSGGAHGRGEFPAAQ